MIGPEGTPRLPGQNILENAEMNVPATGNVLHRLRVSELAMGQDEQHLSIPWRQLECDLRSRIAEKPERAADWRKDVEALE